MQGGEGFFHEWTIASLENRLEARVKSPLTLHKSGHLTGFVTSLSYIAEVQSGTTSALYCVWELPFPLFCVLVPCVVPELALSLRGVPRLQGVVAEVPSWPCLWLYGCRQWVFCIVLVPCIGVCVVFWCLTRCLMWFHLYEECLTSRVLLLRLA
eukprot:Gb_14623 [translate_table: standard]